MSEESAKLYSIISHHGIKGMHWGIRRFQPYPKGKKKGKEVGEAAKKSSQKPLTKEESIEVYERRKEKALKSGTPDEIMSFKGDLTNNQMETAIKRLDLEKKLSNYGKVPEKTFAEKVDQTMKDVKKINEWTNIGIDTYNTFARIYNARNDKKKLKLVGGSPGGGGKGKKKK